MISARRARFRLAVCSAAALGAIAIFFAAPAFASAPELTVRFGTDSIPLNGTTSLTLTIGNIGATNLTSVGFSDALPGLVIANPNGLVNGCGGTATATAGSSAVTLSGGSLLAGNVCAVTVNVTGNATGFIENFLTASSSGGPSNKSNAWLTITGPPKTFSAACSGTTGDPASLITAIKAANGNAGNDTVQLGAGCTYTLSGVDNNWYGPNGLPPIASTIAIEGNGATIARAPGAPPFRLFFIGANPSIASTDNYVTPGPGHLTLSDLTLRGGLAKGGDGAAGGGGGGAGMGGAIFSQGTVSIERSTLTANTAQGGSDTNSFVFYGGGGMGTGTFGFDGGGFGEGTFGGGSGGAGATSGAGGGGAGFRASGEDGNAAVANTPGGGGGPATGLGGGATAGDGSGAGGQGGGTGHGGTGGGFGLGGAAGDGSGGGAGGGVGGGGSEGEIGGSGGFGGGGGDGFDGGDGGFGGGGGSGNTGSGGHNGTPGFGGGTPAGGLGGGGAGMGGAVFNMQGQLIVDNSTLAANTAAGGADPSVTDHAKGIGGAIFNLGGTFSATGSTFAGNSADFDGSSIYNLVYDTHTARAAQTTLRDTVVADGLGAPFELTSNKANIAGATNLGTAVADIGQFDLVQTSHAVDAGTVHGPAASTADPLLGPLQDNGGPTPTMAPAPGSPLIDAGSSFGLTTDQRGEPRPADILSVPNLGDGSDIGAVEEQPAPTGGGGGGGGGGAVAAVTRLKLSPSKFAAAAGRGASISRRHRRKTGTTISYRDSLAATTTFTVQRPARGIRGRHHACVKPKKHGHGKRCTRYVEVGSFTHVDSAGLNSFHFTGRVHRRPLRFGHYRLVAVPRAGSKAGKAVRTQFHIIP